MSKLRDREAAELFYNQLFARMESNEVIEVRLLGSGGPHLRQFKSIKNALNYVEAAREGLDCYIGVALRERGAGNGKSACTRVGAVWVDLDAEIEIEEAQERIQRFPVRPSCLIRTGHGYHAYWLLEKMAGIGDFKRIEAVNRGIALVVGGDLACHDISRIMRVPGSFNYKRTSVCGGFVGKVQPNMYRYLLEQLEVALALSERYEETPPQPSPKAGGSTREVVSGFGCSDGPGRDQAQGTSHGQPSCTAEIPKHQVGSLVIPSGAQRSRGICSGGSGTEKQISHCVRNDGSDVWQGVEEGRRNYVAFSLAGQVRRRGIPEQMCAAALREWNGKNHPPLSDLELCSVIHNVYHGPGASVYQPGRPLPSPPLKWEGAGVVRPLPSPPPQGEGVDQPIVQFDPDSCWKAGELQKVGEEPVEFTVEALVPSRGVTILSGEGGIGKSFIALDLAVAVASGQDFAGQFGCKQGPVLYVDLENDEATIGRRLVQLCAGREVDLEGLQIYIPKRGKPGVELMMDTPEGRAWLWGSVKRYQPRLIIIDSLIAAHQGDENNNVLMRQLVGGLDGIAREGSLAIVVLHHQRKRGTVNDAGQLMRGASDLRNAIISHVAVRRVHDDEILCEHDKCRPAQPSKPFCLKIIDQPDGSVTVSCVGGQAMSKEMIRRTIVLKTLEELSACRSGTLIQKMGCPARTGSRTLSDMVNAGLIIKWPDRMYRLTGMEKPDPAQTGLSGFRWTDGPGEAQTQGTSPTEPSCLTQIPKDESECADGPGDSPTEPPLPEIPEDLPGMLDAFEPEDDDDDYDPVAAGREYAEALRECYDL